MFGKNSYTANVRSALEQMLSDTEVVSSLGAAKFTKKDKKTIGYIYLREGKVYSAIINNHAPNLITRLIQGGHLSEEDVKKITRHFGEGDENDPNLTEFVLDRHMVPEKTMATIQQDFFLEIFSEILSWEEVNADWLQNETTDYYKIDRFDVSKVIELVDTRNAFIENVSKDFNVPIANLDEVSFTKIDSPELDEETPLIFHQLLSMSKDGNTIREAINAFGLTFFRTVQSIHDLWHENYVELTYGGIKIPSYNDSDIEVLEETETIKENSMNPTVYNPSQNNHPFAATNDDEEIELDLEEDTTVPEESEELIIVEKIEEEVEIVSSPAQNSNLEALMTQLSHEIEALKIKIQHSRQKLEEEEKKQTELLKSIASTKNELTTMEEQYNKIVTQLDNMR